MIEVFQTDEFTKWLKDAAAQARILVQIQRLALTEYFGETKQVGDGVFEMRIDYSPGYSLYYALKRNE